MGKSSPVPDATPMGATARRRGLSWKARLFIVWPLYCLLITAIGVGCAMIHYTVIFPNPLALRTQERTPVVRILARDGTLLTQRGKQHEFMPLKLLPRHVIDAVVATEDRRFYSHYGLDPLGLIRASFANLKAGRYVQGGSTLTQQLAKNLFLSPERTLSRKLEELLIALWLEVRLSKSDILEMYLNRVYFGGGAYGIEAAAHRYFEKSARELSISEAAMIAGLLKAPSRYSPRANPGLARKRTRSVLRKMKAAGVLTERQYKGETRRSLRFAKMKKTKRLTGLEFAIDFVLERLPSVVSTDKGNLIVETTLDPALQRSTQKMVTNFLHKHGRKARASQGAVVLLTPNGAIKALVGGRSYRASQYNRAGKAMRQPGSAFKPFVYLAALERGMRPDTITYDRPINIKGWRPRNIGGRYRGAMSMRQALVHSVNTVAVRLHMDGGPQSTVDVAKRLGIKSDLIATPSLALGTSEVTLLEMTGAYAAFANGGHKARPHIIRRIKMSSGRVLYARPGADTKKIVSRRNISAMNDMLNAALVAGTGRSAAIEGHPAAGKTGTSQDFRDAWFVGYTAHYVAGVWLGNDNARTMDKVMGGGLPAQLWQNMMRGLHAGLAPKALPGTKLQPPKRRPPAVAISATIARHRGDARRHTAPQRISEDFFAKALAQTDPDAPVAASSFAYRPHQTQAREPAYQRANGQAVAIERVRREESWWGKNVEQIKKSLQIGDKAPNYIKDLMSLGAPKPDRPYPPVPRN